MKTISSRDNPLYKELKHLAGSSQARRKAGKTLLDGIHLCQTYLQMRGVPLQCVLSQHTVAHPEAESLLARCQAERAECIILPDALYNALSQVEHGVGLLFVIDTPMAIAPPILTTSAVLLDNLQDPGNFGSILRSAAAAGITHIVCSAGSASAWSPKVLRAGMGAHFLLNIYENADLHDTIRDARVAVLATSSHAAQGIYDLDLRQPVAWLFGHEGQGVAEDLLALASKRVAIPQLGAMESLNVAASAAVCFFEQVRQGLASQKKASAIA